MNFHIVEFEAAYGRSRQIPDSDMPEIVFSGKSNVGKSSLINKILYRKSIARVSATPGKTTTINFFKLSDVRFADLPGYGYAKVSRSEKDRWTELVEGYFAQERDIALIVQICDIRHSPTKDDMAMIDFLYNSGHPFIIALTKLDKLKSSQRTPRIEALQQELSQYEGIKLYPCSSQTGEGIDEIRAAIEESVTNE